MDYNDICNFLKIFYKNYFCSLLIKKKNLNQHYVIKLYNNINFLSLFYEEYNISNKLEHNFSNVIDFLIENSYLFGGRRDGTYNILNDIDDITRKINKINFD